MKRYQRILIPFALLIAILCTGCVSNLELAPSPSPSPTPSALVTATPPSEPANAPVYTQAPVPTPVKFPTAGFINGEGVNIRKEPDTASDIVDIMGQNTVLQVLSLENGWYLVDLNGEEAYVKEDLLTLGDPPRPDNTRYAKVTAVTAKLYMAPDGKEAVSTTLKAGDMLKVLRAFGDYLHVVYDRNLQRYIHASDVEYISAEVFAGITPTPSPGTTFPVPASSPSPSPSPSPSSSPKGTA